MRLNVKPFRKKTGSPTMATFTGQRMGKTSLLSNMGHGRHDGSDAEGQHSCSPGSLPTWPTSTLGRAPNIVSKVSHFLPQPRFPGLILCSITWEPGHSSVASCLPSTPLTILLQNLKLSFFCCYCLPVQKNSLCHSESLNMFSKYQCPNTISHLCRETHSNSVLLCRAVRSQGLRLKWDLNLAVF